MLDIKAVLFDIDGTLIDTNEFILQAFEHTFKTHKIENKSRHDVLQIVGPGLKEAYRLLAPELDNDMLFDTHAGFQKQNTQLVKPFPETQTVLTTLKDNEFKIAAVTNRSRVSLGKSLEHVKIHEFFDVVIAYEDVNNAKPSPEGILKTLSLLQVLPEHAVMVGDTGVDIQAGKGAGVMTIGITTGFFDKNRLQQENPDHIINSLTELLPLLIT